MVYRIDPRFPIVWRSPSDLQFGIDPALVVLEEVSDAEQRMITALQTGTSAPGLAMIGGTDPADLLERLTPVLVTGDDRGLGTIAVLGSGRTANLLRQLVAEHGATVTDDPAAALDAAVLVAHHVIPPGARHEWSRREVPHLPVVITDQAATIGPWVVPGATPCLTCLELHHRDRDPAWPALASQLVDLGTGADTGALAADAAAAAVRLLLEHRGPAASTRIDAASGQRAEQQVPPHPSCGCLGPAPLTMETVSAGR